MRFRFISFIVPFLLIGPCAIAGPPGDLDPDAARALLASRETFLTSPDAPVDSAFLDSLTTLNVYVNHPSPNTAGSVPNPGPGPFRWQLDQQNPNGKIDARYAAELRNSLPQKLGSAKVVSMIALLRLDPAAAQPLATAKSIPEVFEQLPVNMQCAVLQDGWRWMGSAELLSDLLDEYQHPPAPDGDAASKADLNYQLHDLCLLRAFEIDPQRAEPLIVEAIASTQDFSARHIQSLLAIRAGGSPQIEAALADQLSGNHPAWDFDILALLINHYGSPALLPKAREFIEPHLGYWACAVQYPILAHLVRFDDTYGSQVIKKALSLRGPGHSRCWASLLRDLSSLVWTSGLEQLCMDSLDDPQPEVAASAAYALEHDGSPDTRNALFAALARDWKPGANIDTRIVRGNPADLRTTALVHALLNGHAWVLTADELNRLKPYAKGPQNSSVQDGLAGRVSVAISTEDSLHPLFQIHNSQFNSLNELEQKAALYPVGTTFTMTHFDNHVFDFDTGCQEFLTWAQKGGYKAN